MRTFLGLETKKATSSWTIRFRLLLVVWEVSQFVANNEEFLLSMYWGLSQEVGLGRAPYIMDHDGEYVSLVHESYSVTHIYFLNCYNFAFQLMQMENARPFWFAFTKRAIWLNITFNGSVENRKKKRERKKICRAFNLNHDLRLYGLVFVAQLSSLYLRENH